MIHDLLATVLSVHTVLTCLTELGVQSSSVTTVLRQCHSPPNHIQEPVHPNTVTPVTKQRLLTRLTHALVNHSKLEIVRSADQLIIMNQKLRG